MNLWPFRKYDPEKAALRDQLIIAETRAALLRDLVEHPPQPRLQREPRRDKGTVMAARLATTQALRASTKQQIKDDEGVR